MLVCVECGSDYDDSQQGMNYFICTHCLIDIEQ